jgi:hypothetical protein
MNRKITYSVIGAILFLIGLGYFIYGQIYDGVGTYTATSTVRTYTPVTTTPNPPSPISSTPIKAQTPTSTTAAKKWFTDTAAKIKQIDSLVKQTEQLVIKYDAVIGTNPTPAQKEGSKKYHFVWEGQKAQYNAVASEYNTRAKSADQSIFVGIPKSFPLKTVQPD